MIRWIERQQDLREWGFWLPNGIRSCSSAIAILKALLMQTQNMPQMFKGAWDPSH